MYIWKEHFYIISLILTKLFPVLFLTICHLKLSSLAWTTPYPLDEIELVIKHFSNHKSAGCNDIQARISSASISCVFFNKYFSYGSIPSAWLKSIIQLIEESGADPLNPSEYGSISLQLL